MSENNLLLYDLLRVALCCPYEEAALLSRLSSLNEEDWVELLALSRKQAVSGLVYDALQQLDCHVPEQIALPLMMDASSIEIRSRKVKSLADSLIELLSGKGLHPCIIKGPAVAAYYPRPDLRVSGDIDFYVPATESADARGFLSAALGREKSDPDESFHYKARGIEVELHNSFYDFPADGLPDVSTPEATVCMLSSHILKHALGHGVGLRQICDMAMACRALPFDSGRLEKVFRSTGTLRWNRMLSALLRERLGVDSGFFKDSRRTSFSSLERIIFTGGNFGQHVPSRKKAMEGPAIIRKLNTAVRFLRRIPFACRYAPKGYLVFLGTLFKGNLERQKV